MTAGYALLGLFALGFVVLLAAGIRRSRLKKESDAALDHLDEGGARDYSRPGSTFMPENEEENTADDTEYASQEENTDPANNDSTQV